MAVHFSPASHGAPNLLGATIQTARKRFELETFSTGGRVDCFLLSTLRSISTEQQEELRPILAEMSSTEYSFLQKSVVTPQAPLQPEVIPQPPLSQADRTEKRPCGARQDEESNGGARQDAHVCDIKDAQH